MEGLFRREVGSEFQGGTDVLDGEVVLPLNVVERHATGKAPDHDGYRHPSAPDDQSCFSI